MNKKAKIKMPSAFSILFILIIIVAVFTHIIPSGQYDYVDKTASNRQPISGTYHLVDANPQSIEDIIVSPVKGFIDASDIIIFVLVIGGFLRVVMKTGAIDAGIGQVVRKMKGREKWMIPLLMAIFFIGGTTYGMAEETLAFLPFLIPVFFAAGYDSLTVFSVVRLGTGLGIMASILDPFSVGIASRFAGISIGNGIGIRAVMLAIVAALGIVFTMRYAEKVKNDPSKSLMYSTLDEDRKFFLSSKSEDSIPPLTGKRQLILWIFGLTFIIMIFGIIPFRDLGVTAIPTLNWWFSELSGLFLVSSILIALVAGMEENQMIQEFINGAGELLGVALIIACSRAITLVMNSGNISDTILHFGETMIKGTSSWVFTTVMYLFYLPMTFLLPSSSALATLTMPIMAPLGSFAGVTKDIIVSVYTFASGLLLIISPTSGIVMGGLAICRIPYGKWIKHVWKLLIVVMIISLVALGAATLI